VACQTGKGEMMWLIAQHRGVDLRGGNGGGSRHLGGE